jgi:ankyrin repeat protein
MCRSYRRECTPSAAPDVDNRLIRAALVGDPAQVQQLLVAGINANARNEVGKRALMFSTEEGHGQIVGLLPSRGANIDAQSHADCTSRW